MKLITLTTVTLILLCLASVPNGVLASTTAASSTSTPASSTEKPIDCGETGEPTDCVACNPTCKDPYPEICPRPICKPGCNCKMGYFKDSKGNCVSILGCIMENIEIKLSEWNPSTAAAQK